MPDGHNERFVVEDTTEVAYMHFVVRDKQTNQPVAYSSRWLDAHESAKRFTFDPPFRGYSEDGVKR